VLILFAWRHEKVLSLTAAFDSRIQKTSKHRHSSSSDHHQPQLRSARLTVKRLPFAMTFVLIAVDRKEERKEENKIRNGGKGAGVNIIQHHCRKCLKTALFPFVLSVKYIVRLISFLTGETHPHFEGLFNPPVPRKNQIVLLFKTWHNAGT
jgi:hypothetical protein